MLIDDDTTTTSSGISEQEFWQKIKSLPAGTYCSLIETALTLYALLTEGSLTTTQVVALVFALGYFILPIDVIPDFLPLVGYSDDLSLLLATLSQFQSEVSPAIKAKVYQWLPSSCQQQSLDDYLQD